MQNIHLRWIKYSAGSLETDSALAKQWDRLNSERGNLPFLSADAISCALSAFGTGKERLFCGYVETRPIAMFLLVPNGMFRWRTFQPSQIPLGAWVAEADTSIEVLSQSLLNGPLRVCLALSVTQVDPLVAPASSETSVSMHSDYIDTGWIEIDGSFDDYWGARGKNLRQNLRKQHKKLEVDGVKLAFNELRNIEDIAPALERYGQLESTGWKADLGTAIHPNNQQGLFYRLFLERAAARGEAVVYECLFDDKVVAMNLCLLRDQHLVVLKTAYDESIKNYSPAFLLREYELQLFFEQKNVKRIEYFGRLMEWHMRLTDNKRTLYHYTVYRYSWVKKFNELRNRRSTTPTKTIEISIPEKSKVGS